MKPLSRSAYKSPSKEDANIKGYSNWWEEICVKGKGKQKQEVQKEIQEQLLDYKNKDK